MPEGDRFERAFRAGWRSAYRLAREDASAEDVADKLIASLAKSLRDQLGVPGLPNMQRLIQKTNRQLVLDSGSEGMQAVALAEFFNAMDRIQRESEGHRHTKVAADVGKSIFARENFTKTNGLPGRVVRQFAEGVCLALVRHYFFARARQNLISERILKSHQQATEWQNKVERIMLPAIEKIGDQLASDNEARSLRAPRRLVKKQSTRDLLNDNLVSNSLSSPRSLVETR